MTALLTEIYDIVNKNREAAKEGWVRPTIGEHFMTNKTFLLIEKPPEGLRPVWDFDYTINVVTKGFAGEWEKFGTSSNATGHILSAPSHPMMADTKGTFMVIQDYGYSTWVGLASVDKELASGVAYSTRWTASTASDVYSPLYITVDLPAKAATVYRNNGVVNNQFTDVEPSNVAEGICLHWANATSNQGGGATYITEIDSYPGFIPEAYRNAIYFEE